MLANTRPMRRIFSQLLIIFAVLLFASTAYSQTSPLPGSPASDPMTDSKDHKSEPYGSPENEMRDKLVLREEKKRYDENLGRAHEVAELASQVLQSYDNSKSLSADDAKRLERLEKLTKRIRNEAGGSDSEADDDNKDSPTAVDAVLKRVSNWADELQKLVEKTPRQVVSATVIEQANKLIGLVQRLRGANK